ncbi:uncharacterized protein MYCFIDRAFT_212372 [Pseudocercospora fijiensis CIRAD86]|uniref:Hemerythrin-like domain-containing protein n=1 Tax=Pseudocercospora fijiensis (strain CIRAD86) TaxID=383855 RepID=M2YKX6_PSEFD|nr:uncharacterized protein MYCFIDRAFT_212372 [Pseudocercospora fijiensis CIRAD86]EME78385.1 hypothetical protein MYCFIDRAFT_212372 [Pseudocercospora fijiensis CIRAD86]
MAEQNDDALQKMSAEEIPKASEPTEIAPTTTEKEGEKLPKLSPQDFRVYNRMAEHMDLFHENFRQTWNTLYHAASTNSRPNGMSIRQFLALAEQFSHHLTVHHTIEEQHIFPVLARKMDVFKNKEHLLEQHKGIHQGLEGFEEYIAKCRSGEKELRLQELKELMDGFGDVLWTHLDDEVRTLGAENVRRYWTLEEMRRLPM